MSFNMNRKTTLNLTTSLPTLTVLVFLTIILSSCQPIEEKFDHLPPEENRFTTTNLNQPGSLDEPMAFTFLDNEEMLIVDTLIKKVGQEPQKKV